MSIILLQMRMLFSDICKQMVKILANMKNLAVIIAQSHVLTLEFNNVGFLVEGSFNSVFAHHLRYNAFGLRSLDFKETAELFKGDILVYL